MAVQLEEIVSEETLTEIEKRLPPDEELQELADFFKVFGDVTRLKILNVLSVSEMCVQGLSSAIGMSESAVSHQLRTLKQMGLAKNRREGKVIYYSLADTHIMTILNTGIEHIEE